MRTAQQPSLIPLLNPHIRVNRQVGQPLQRTARPIDVQRIYPGRRTQAKVHAPVAAAQKALAAEHIPPLPLAAAPQYDLRADGLAVFPRTHKAQTEPVMAGGRLVVQQGGPTVEVGDEQIYAAIVVKIPSHRAATNRPIFAQLDEAKMAGVIGEQVIGLRVGRATARAFDLRIHVPVGHEQVLVGIVVKIEKDRAEPHEGKADAAQARGKAHVRKRTASGVAIQCIVVVLKIGDQQIAVAVVVVIAPSRAHAGLRQARFPQRGIGL